MQIRSLLGGYPGHDALPHFLRFFQKKIPTTVPRPIAQAKGFLDGNSILREVRAMAYVG
jgi:hypothetical protein